MEQRNLSKELARNTKSPDDYSNYKRLRNLALKRQRADKQAWAAKLLSAEGNQSKVLWQAVKRISGDSNQTNIISLAINNVSNYKTLDIANCLNEHFVNKVEDLVKGLPSPSKDVLTELSNTPTPLVIKWNFSLSPKLS